jgi:hypothetical protein
MTIGGKATLRFFTKKRNYKARSGSSRGAAATIAARL